MVDIANFMDCYRATQDVPLAMPIRGCRWCVCEDSAQQKAVTNEPPDL